MNELTCVDGNCYQQLSLRQRLQQLHLEMLEVFLVIIIDSIGKGPTSKKADF